jgi:hypothetical protein
VPHLPAAGQPATILLPLTVSIPPAYCSVCDSVVRPTPSQATTQAPAATAAHAPNNSPTMPGQASGGKGALVAASKGLDAPPQAIAAAKAAPATRVDPADPPKPLTQSDFRQLIKSLAEAHRGNVEVVTVNNQALVRPRHWDYIDYDIYHRPTVYNPISEAMTFRYFYACASREVSDPADGRVVLDIATAGVFPFTAVSDSYVPRAASPAAPGYPQTAGTANRHRPTPRRHLHPCTTTMRRQTSPPTTKPCRSAR